MMSPKASFPFFLLFSSPLLLGYHRLWIKCALSTWSLKVWKSIVSSLLKASLTFRITWFLMSCVTIIKAALARLLFAGHSWITVWRVVEQEKIDWYWRIGIAIILILLVEGFHALCYRKGEELPWLCPSVLIYLSWWVTNRKVTCFCFPGKLNLFLFFFIDATFQAKIRVFNFLYPFFAFYKICKN